MHHREKSHSRRETGNVNKFIVPKTNDL